MLKVPLSKWGDSLLHSLESLREDHQKFLDAGGDIHKAKEFDNVIGEVFFPISFNVQAKEIARTDVYTMVGWLMTTPSTNLVSEQTGAKPLVP